MVNEWTREDLPSEDHLLTVFRAGDPAKASTYERGGIIAVLDAVLDHLRINPGPSAREERVAVDDLRRLRRAHSIVEGERDQARRERDGAVQARNTALVLVSQAQDERDEAVARAEAAEARTAPAVTKAEVGKVVREALVLHGVAPERVTDAVWSLVSGADPAVFVVRESDVAAVEVKRHDDGFMETPLLRGHLDEDQSMLRHPATGYLQGLVETEALARAIEDGQATDPVEELAGQIESATREAIRQVCVDLADVAPSLDPLTVERAMEVTAASRKVAAHILGQEAKR